MAVIASRSCGMKEGEVYRYLCNGRQYVTRSTLLSLGAHLHTTTCLICPASIDHKSFRIFRQYKEFCRKHNTPYVLLKRSPRGIHTSKSRATAEFSWLARIKRICWCLSVSGLSRQPFPFKPRMEKDNCFARIFSVISPMCMVNVNGSVFFKHSVLFGG